MQTTLAPLAVRGWIEEPEELSLEELAPGVLHLDGEGRPRYRNRAAEALLEGMPEGDVERALTELRVRLAGTPGPVEAAVSLPQRGELHTLLARADCVGGFLAVLARPTAAAGSLGSHLARALASLAHAPVHTRAVHRALSAARGVLARGYLVAYALDEGGDTLSCVAHVGTPSTHDEVLGRHGLGPSSWLAGRAFTARRPLYVANLARSVFSFERGLAAGERMAALALPVEAGDEALGVLYVCGPRGPLVDGELALLRGVADVVGALLFHAKHEGQLARRRSALATAVEGVSDAVLELEPDGRVHVAAGPVEAVFGLPAKHLEGRSVFSLLPPDDNRQLGAALESLAVGGKARAEVSVTRGDDVLACDVSLSALETVGGARVLRAVFRDVSPRRRLEAEVSRLREAALQQDRFSVIGQLAAGVAHEINNPLSFVKANLALMTDALRALKPGLDALSRSGEPGGAADLLDMVRESVAGVARIEAIVANLKGIARTRPGEKTSYDPSLAVLQAVQFFTGAKHCRERVSVEVGELPEVVGEAGGLSQVVLNLLDNAWDAVRGAGRIRVAAGLVDGRVRVSVSDDGPGIPAEVQPHLFELLFTTKDSGKGTGLGLYISRHIVSASGGTLRFETGPTGTTFIVELPVADVPMPAPRACA